MDLTRIRKAKSLVSKSQDSGLTHLRRERGTRNDFGPHLYPNPLRGRRYRRSCGSTSGKDDVRTSQSTLGDFTSLGGFSLRLSPSPRPLSVLGLSLSLSGFCLAVPPLLPGIHILISTRTGSQSRGVNPVFRIDECRVTRA